MLDPQHATCHHISRSRAEEKVALILLRPLTGKEAEDV
jgi:hypothetical protein